MASTYSHPKRDPRVNPILSQLKEALVPALVPLLGRDPILKVDPPRWDGWENTNSERIEITRSGTASEHDVTQVVVYTTFDVDPNVVGMPPVFGFSNHFAYQAAHTYCTENIRDRKSASSELSSPNRIAEAVKSIVDTLTKAHKDFLKKQKVRDARKIQYEAVLRVFEDHGFEVQNVSRRKGEEKPELFTKTPGPVEVSVFIDYKKFEQGKSDEVMAFLEKVRTAVEDVKFRYVD